MIPARGGSKGIPRKNLVQIAGRPLLAYAIESARSAMSVDRVLVSTDDREIADVACALGADVPFMRPPELADDSAPMLGVLRHVLAWLESREDSVEALVLLQPTSPLRTHVHVEEAIRLFRSAPASSVVSVVEVPHKFNPVSVMTLAEGVLQPFLGQSKVFTRRQEKPRIFARNGPAVLICHPDTLRAGELYGNCCLPYVMLEDDSLDIDLPQDLFAAEQILKTRI